jgi:hypothetical protein
LLKDIKEKTSVNSRQLDILIRLNFFSDFGGNAYLLKVNDVYNKFAEAKIIAKKKVEELGLSEYILQKYCGKETPSQWRDIDNDGLIKELCGKIENKSLGIKEQIGAEVEYLGYANYTNKDISEHYYVVTRFDDSKCATRPYCTLYRICDGEKIDTRVNRSEIFKQNSFGLFSIINMPTMTYEYKKVKDGDKVVAKKSVKATNPMTIVLPVKNVKTWSPDSPFLYGLEYEVVNAEGQVVDQVVSYAGMRKIHIEGNRVFLNNEPLYLRMVLDQGFYPEGVWTAPTDEALKQDIEMSMSVGFNSARLHQKVFEERFHYWADKLGYITWGESASWGADTNNEMAARNFLNEWREVVTRDRNHPSIVIWTPFNETWERPKGVEEARHQDRFISDVYDLTKTLDYRPVHDVSGGYHVKTDIWSYHNYEQDPVKLKERLTVKNTGEVPTLAKDREAAYSGQPYYLDEYGGIKWVIEQYASNTWGYGQGPKSLDEFYTRLEALTNVLLGFDYINGYTYTQLTDVEQEQNGIFTYDRKPKFDPAKLKAIFGKVPAWAEPKKK